MSDKLDLNSADQAALDAIEALKGHGPEIVRYRQERGGFTDVRQLDEVPGLTGKKLGAETFSLLTVGGC
jgi:competence protein ComEA